MLITLAEAAVGVSLVVRRISPQDFADRLARLGVYEGARIMRLEEAVAIGPAKIRAPGGDVTLGGWLAAKVVAHLDDDRRIPLLECAPGDTGHVEGVTGHKAMEESLAALGVAENDRITFLRRLPPMLYRAVVDGKDRIQMNEGLAAKILGDTPSGAAQFCAVGVGEPFVVSRILAGERAGETLDSLGVRPGRRLVLTDVAAGQVFGFSPHAPVACSTREGARLYFQRKDAERVLVEPARAT